jgi:hypothetical protein
MISTEEFIGMDITTSSPIIGETTEPEESTPLTPREDTPQGALEAGMRLV